MKTKMGASAASEIVSMIVLLIIAISVFSILYINVLSDDGSDPDVYVTIIGKIESGKIVFEHRRGESLDLDTQVMLNVDGQVQEPLTVEDLLDTDLKSDGFWNIGEQLTYQSSYSMSEQYWTNQQVEAIIVDKDSNSIVFWGVLDGYMSPFWKRYSLWANSGINDIKIEWPGSWTTINGDIHANYGVKISGSDNTVNGDITYIDYFEDSGSNNNYDSVEQISSPLPFPLNYDIIDYQPGGIEAVKAQNEGKYYYIDGDFVPSNDYSEIPKGLYYVTGKVDIGKTGLTGNVTIVAEGEIIIGGSYNCFKSYCNDLLFFSLANKFTLSGQYTELCGIICIPNGMISLSGSDHIVVGGFYGDTITYGASNCLITISN